MDKITVSREKFNKIYEIIKKQKLKEISFEFLVGSCFPDVMNNIKEEMRRQHAQGYAEGLKAKPSRRKRRGATGR